VTLALAEGVGFEPNEGLSSLPVFKFGRIPSARVRNEQFRTVVNPREGTSSARMHPLGGQQ
jgi:hypothetical protein